LHLVAAPQASSALRTSPGERGRLRHRDAARLQARRSYLPPRAVRPQTPVYLFQIPAGLFRRDAGDLVGGRNREAGVSVTDDLRNLRRLLEFEAKRWWISARLRNARPQADRCAQSRGDLHGARIPKGAKTTNWAARHLTPQQITTRRPMPGRAASCTSASSTSTWSEDARTRRQSEGDPRGIEAPGEGELDATHRRQVYGF
jgi:hypothetical protein